MQSNLFISFLHDLRVSPSAAWTNCRARSFPHSLPAVWPAARSKL